MKTKNIYYALMATVLSVLSLGLTACGDDNDEPEMPDTWATSYTVTANFGPDMFEMVDITAHIVKPDGSISEEAVLQQKYTLKMTGNKIPDKAGVLFTFVPKDNLDPDKVYKVQLDRTIVAASYKNGKVFSDYGPSLVSTKQSIKGSQVVKYFTGKGIAVTAGISADGNAANVDADDFDFGLNGVWEWLAGVLNGADQ